MDERMKETIKRTEDELAYCTERNFTTCPIRIEDVSYLLRKVNELIEENERLRGELEAVNGLLSLRDRQYRELKAELARLRGESPDAGWKELKLK